MRKIFCLIFIWVLWSAGPLEAETLTLEECVKQALSRYPRMEAVKQQVLAAKAHERAAYKNLFPSLGTSYTYTRLRDQRTVVFMGNEIPISDNTSARGEISVTWPLFHGLALRVSHRLAELDVELAQVEKERVRQELVFHVKEAYYRLLQAKRRAEEAQKSVERLRAHVKEARGLYEQGLIAKNDLLQSEVALAEAEHALVIAQNAVELARSQLNVLLQRPVTARTEVVGQNK